MSEQNTIGELLKLLRRHKNNDKLISILYHLALGYTQESVKKQSPESVETKPETTKCTQVSTQ